MASLEMQVSGRILYDCELELQQRLKNFQEQKVWYTIGKKYWERYELQPCTWQGRAMKQVAKVSGTSYDEALKNLHESRGTGDSIQHIIILTVKYELEMTGEPEPQPKPITKRRR